MPNVLKDFSSGIAVVKADNRTRVLPGELQQFDS